MKATGQRGAIVRSESPELRNFESLWGNDNCTLEQSASSHMEQTAYDRGFRDGTATERAASEVLLQSKHNEWCAALSATRAESWRAGVMAICEQIEIEIKQLEGRLSSALADMLVPLVARHLSKDADDQLMRAVRQVVALKGALDVLLEGPQPSLEGLREQIEALGLRVRIQESNDKRILVRIGDSELISLLPDRLSALRAVLE